MVVAGDICPKTPLSPRAARQPEANLPSRALDGRRWAEGEGELKNQFLGPKLPTLITRSPSPALAPVGGAGRMRVSVELGRCGWNLGDLC